MHITTGVIHMGKLCTFFSNCLGKLSDFPPLFFRLVLAFGFYEPAMRKLGNVNGIAHWFENMGILYPVLNAYIVTTSEVLGVVLLTLGLGTRLISIPLISIMAVAIQMVHWKNGFAAGSNGFEIPLYYLLMLFSLLVTGPGRISLDAWLCCKYSCDSSKKEEGFSSVK